MPYTVALGVMGAICEVTGANEGVCCDVLIVEAATDCSEPSETMLDGSIMTTGAAEDVIMVAERDCDITVGGAG